MTDIRHRIRADAGRIRSASAWPWLVGTFTRSAITRGPGRVSVSGAVARIGMPVLAGVAG